MHTTPTDPSGGDGDSLLGVMALAVILASAAIAGLAVLGSWWLLPVAMATVIALAVAVAYALVQLMSADDPAAAQRPEPETAARPQHRVLAGH